MLAVPAIALQSARFATQFRAWRRLLDVLAPDVIFGGRLEHSSEINAGAHAAGVPTVTVKLGVGEEMIPSLSSFKPDGRMDQRACPDRYLVWGAHQKRYLESRFEDLVGRVTVSGRTRNDAFVREAGLPDVDRVKSILGSDSGDRVVLFGGTCRTRYGLWPGAASGTCCMSPFSFRHALQALADLAERSERVRILVKPHRADDDEMIRSMITEIASDKLVLVDSRPGVHNSHLLAASSVFVSSVSSMFAEAVVSGRVAVNLWTPEVGFLYEQDRCDLYQRIAHTVTSVPDMVDTVQEYLHDDKAYARELRRAKENLPDLFGWMDGGNARRAVEAGIQFIDQPRDFSPNAAVRGAAAGR